jgi:pyridoxine kinase
MAHVLILSSWVASGHVGLCASVPAVQALGHTVTQVPTVMLSNHPGWPHVAGQQVPVGQILGMVAALDANGWLADHDALLIGYLPTPEHVALACDLVLRLRRQAETGPRVVVDPVLGDMPEGLYLPEPVATAMRDRLVPLADVLTPNRFELGWLTGLPVDTLDQARTAAVALRNQSRAQSVICTSAPLGSGATGLLDVAPQGAHIYRTPLREGVPKGVGDVFAGLIAAGRTPGQALGCLASLIDASLHAPHLRIFQSAPVWTRAAPANAKEF